MIEQLQTESQNLGPNEPKIWKPFLKQEQFIALPFSIFEALYGGAAGGGKSEMLVLLPLIYNFHLHHKFKGIILRRTFPELEKEIINRSFEYYEAAGGKYNKQEKRWKFPSGAEMQFGHAENEQDIRKYDGVEYNYAAFDELTHFTEFQYLYLVGSRCRSSTPDLPSIVRNSTNPGNVGHAWVRRRFVEPCVEGGKIIVDKVTKIKRFYLQAKATDNPYLMRNDPEYISRMEMLPEAEKRAKAYGDWFTFSGQVFDNFRVEPLSDEPANAKHVIEPFAIPDFWPKVNFTDWGFTANTASLWGAISPEGRVYVYREYVVKETPVAVWGTEIGEFNRRDKNIRVVGIDTNAWDQRGEERTIAEQFTAFAQLGALKLSLQPASKGRISGKMLIQEFLRWKQKPKSTNPEPFNPDVADSLLRFKGIDVYNEYLNRFRPEPDEQNIPKLQIFSTCTELIRVLPLCIYDETNKEDVAEFEGDDIYDCLRYLLKGIARFLDESKSEFDKIRKLAKIEDTLRSTHDLTSYHIARARIEAKGRPTVVKRFHDKVRKVRAFDEIFGS